MHSTVLSKYIGPLQIISTKPDTVTADEDGIHSKMFIDHVTTALEETDQTSVLKKAWTYPTRQSRNDGTDEA